MSNGAADDHSIIVLMQCPVVGIMSAAFKGFMITYICNILSDYPVNSICLLVHPNRASQDKTGLFTHTHKKKVVLDLKKMIR